jgi:AmiR/NasT family two-component response regulator
MKIMASARVVVLHADPHQRGILCSALAELGMLQVHPAGSLGEVRLLAGASGVDLCVVDAASLAIATPAAIGGFPPSPFDPARTPAILLARDVSRETLKAAAASGYNTVLAAPVAPRLLYRRIGSLLQKARRASRAEAASIAAGLAARRVELRDA